MTNITRLGLLAAVAFCCGLHAGGEPQLEVAAINAAPVDQATQVRVRVRIVNTTEKTFYYIGGKKPGGEDSIVYTESKMENAWRSNNIVLSGIFWTYAWPPGAVLEMEARVFPPIYTRDSRHWEIRNPIRFRFDCSASKDGPDNIHFYSSECSPQEFWMKP